MNTDPPIIHEGIIQVADSESGKILGYVSNKLTLFGQCVFTFRVDVFLPADERRVGSVLTATTATRSRSRSRPSVPTPSRAALKLPYVMRLCQLTGHG